MNIKALEKIFKIKITDENLFKKALTHPSFTKENDINSLENYERLEFFGDAVLKIAISEILYKKYPKSNEGELTKIRSIIVSDMMLSKISEILGLQNLILLGKNAEKAGERKRLSINACVFEALFGAFYLDNKKEEIITFIQKTFEKYIEDIKENFVKYNAKELLQEYTQSKTKETPTYTLIKEIGPAHEPKFEVEVSYKKEVLATAIGCSKKDAEQKCALEACKKLGVISGK